MNQNVLPWVWLSSSHIPQQCIHLLRIPLRSYLKHWAAVMETSFSSPWHEEAWPKQNVAIIDCLCHPFAPEKEEIFLLKLLYTQQRKSRNHKENTFFFLRTLLTLLFWLYNSLQYKFIQKVFIIWRKGFVMILGTLVKSQTCYAINW